MFVVERFALDVAANWRDRDAHIARVLDYFEAKTGDQRLPKRGGFNPYGLRDILPEVALFEPQYGPENPLDNVFVKLQGTKLDEYYGQLQHHRAPEDHDPDVSNRIMQACRYCINACAPIVVAADTLSRSKDFLKATILYVPLSEDGHTIDRFFVYNRVTSCMR